MSNEDDKVLDEYLKGGGEISKMYAESGDEECPPELQDKILAQSRKEAGSKPRLLRSPAVRRGLIPLAIAATLLVGVGIINIFPQDKTSEESTLTFRGAPSKDQQIEYSTPEDWLEAIRMQINQGNMDQAKMELRKFVSVNRDYPIEDLKELLNE